MTKPRQGFVMLEVLIALALFASAGTALVVALNEVGNVTFELNRDRRLARILDSELRQVMSLPTLEEGKNTRPLDELGVEIETLIQAIEEMENQDGQVLQNMFLIRVSAVWWADGAWQSESTETWRYANLYRQ
ncbi:MAG: prepilin-type N-terminal cleavage/methylation domain-containing protein [Verrucomicrobiota bacterium JB023]|nr:prepilin-type N-terminal cleavage/methylation domain-containing protein [Verrucomicrobiota bacterium JB023]